MPNNTAVLKTIKPNAAISKIQPDLCNCVTENLMFRISLHLQSLYDRISFKNYEKLLQYTTNRANTLPLNQCPVIEIGKRLGLRKLFAKKSYLLASRHRPFEIE